MQKLLGWKSKSVLLFLAVLLQPAAATAAAITLASLEPTTEAVAIAFDEVSNRLYVLESTGALTSLQLSPTCEVAGGSSCPPSTLMTTTIFPHPIGLAVNGKTGLAYVTTDTFDRNPTGTPWRVNLNGVAGPAVAIATKLGGLFRIALAPEINAAFITSIQELLRVDLSTGQASVIATPPGGIGALVVNSARTLAYSLEPPVRIVVIDLVTGNVARIIGPPPPRFGNFFNSIDLAWTDSSESALYAALGFIGGSSTVVRITLADSTQIGVASFVSGEGRVGTGQAGGLAVNPSGSGFYVGGDHSLIRFPLSAIPNGQIFLSIGNIPALSIQSNGYANTGAGTPFKVVDAPFGGTLDIFANLPSLVNSGADSYEVIASSPSVNNGVPFPIVASWTAYRWKPDPQNPLLGHYEPFLVAPDPNFAGLYSIPPEYTDPSTVPYLSPTYLMMRWPTSENGLYTLEIRIFKHPTFSTITEITPRLAESLNVLVDNTLPVAALNSISVFDPSAPGGLRKIPACEIVTSPSKAPFDFNLTANDLNGHLLSYSLSAAWGRSRSATVLSDSYSSQLQKGLVTSPFWSGFTNVDLPIPPAGWAATCDCAHTFVLQVSKRTINGYGYILSSSSSESITISNTGNVCP